MKKEKHIYPLYTSEKTLRGYQIKIRYEGDKLYTKFFNAKDYLDDKTTLKAAILHRNEMLIQISNQRVIDRPKFTVREVFYKSLEVFPGKLTTLNKRIKRYNKYILPSFDQINIQKLKSIDVQLALNKVTDTASQDTIKAINHLWCLIFKTARLLKAVDINIMEEVIIRKSHKMALKRDVSTDLETFKKVIDLLNSSVRHKDEYFNKLHIIGLWIMLYTGMRPTEAFALQRSNIDTTAWSIRIQNALGSTSTKIWDKTETKTPQSKRTVPITDELKPHILELLQLSDNEELFMVDGQYFNLDKARLRINKVCKKHGIAFNMYRLRHKFSTDLVTNNVDPRTIIELMGHKDYPMSIEYARSNLQLKKDALKNRKL